jgi:hypothetical protein
MGTKILRLLRLLFALLVGTSKNCGSHQSLELRTLAQPCVYLARPGRISSFRGALVCVYMVFASMNTGERHVKRLACT